MCERCDQMDAVGAAVDEAVADEALPSVCTAPSCSDAPVARMSASDDSVQLLCPIHLLGFGVYSGIGTASDAVEHGGVSIPESSRTALHDFAMHAIVSAGGLELL